MALMRLAHAPLSRRRLISRSDVSVPSVRTQFGMVGRDGLEPSASAVIGPERCAYESGRPSVGRDVMWSGILEWMAQLRPSSA